MEKQRFGDGRPPENAAMPLAGTKVLEFSGLGPTPFGAMLLADLGASVLRIERAGAVNPLGGDPRFDFIYRGRPSMAVDLKSPEGLERVRDLAGAADVLIEGYRPGTMERLGLGPDSLCADNKRLIYARMSGWGQDGPLSGKAGHDINYLALSGALFPLGPSDAPPVPPLNYVGNFGGGGTFLAMGVLAAMQERQRSGTGQVLDVAMIDGISVLMTQLSGWMQMGQWSAGRGGNLLDGSAYFYRCYATRDGRHIAVGALEKPFHDAFVSALGLDPEDWNDHLEPSHWAIRGDRIAAIVAGETLEHWLTVFDGVDACVSPVLSVDEAARDTGGTKRGSWVRDARSFQPFPAPRFSRSPVRQPSPTLDSAELERVLHAWRAEAAA